MGQVCLRSSSHLARRDHFASLALVAIIIAKSRRHCAADLPAATLIFPSRFDECQASPQTHAIAGYLHWDFAAQNRRQVPQALEETRSVIASGAVPALFEAAFGHRGVLVRPDVIDSRTHSRDAAFVG